MTTDHETPLDCNSRHTHYFIYNYRTEHYITLCLLNIADLTDMFLSVMSCSK